MNIRFLTNCLIALYCVPLLHGQIITRIDTLRFSAKTPIDTLSSTPVIDNTLLVLQGADPGLTLVSHGSGLVKAANPPVDATDVIVSYQTPAVPLATVYGPAWRYLPSLDDVLPDTAVSANPVSHQASIRTEGGRATSLVSAGSLFRGVQVSTTHGARLTGGLDLAFQGDLGGGLFIDGQLTDQDLPIQPEGNTRTLNE
ncbi:MAG: hypothetical protein KAU50_04335, partial [Candidatus Marinimicrobia bacterium]|nr:hypothetical protein [Candidatus Neomarinimicrobiota bacterium]